MVSRDIIQRLLAIINDTRARLNTLESREVALLTATQTLTNKTLTTPTIGNFTNAQHAHTGATSGGTISHGSLTDLTTGDPHTQYLLESTYDANTILKADADNTPIALTVGASTIVGRASTGNIAALTAAQVATIVQSSIDHSQLTNLTTGDPHTQYLLESTYDANTILKADADNTPIALTVGASTIVGRASTGNIAALTAAQVATIVQGSIDHGSIAGLADDDHTGYARLAGRSGGQTLIGGTAANNDLTLEGTSNATRTTSYVILQPNGGNVGIGTTSPSQKLDIRDSANFLAVNVGDSTQTNFSNLVLASDSGAAQLWKAGSLYSSGWGGATSLNLYNSSGPVAIFSNGTINNSLFLDNSGKFGIGTTSPSQKLDIRDSANFLAVNVGDSTQTNYSILVLVSDSGNVQLWKAGSIYSGWGGATSLNLYNSSGPVAIFSNGTINNSLFLDNSGKFGIGTTSPSRKLHVAGTILIDGDEGSGIAGTIGLTDVNDATLSTGNGTVKLKGTTDRDSAGFIKIYVGATTAWIPYWTNIS